MDRKTFAACAVIALPLAILSVGCDATPAGSSRSTMHNPPAVLAQLQSYTPDAVPAASDAPDRSRAIEISTQPAGLPNGPTDLATQPASQPSAPVDLAAQSADLPKVPVEISSEPAAVTDESGEMRFVISAPPSEPADMRFIVDVPAADSPTVEAEGTSTSSDIRTVPVESASEPLDAPLAPEPEAPLAAEAPSATVAPSSEPQTELVPPSFDLDTLAPPTIDSPAPQTEAPVEVERPAAPAPADAPSLPPPAVGQVELPISPPEAATPAESPAERPQIAPPREQPRPSTVAPPALAPSRRELPWANAKPHSAEMQAVVERADSRVQHAFQLAERGALYSARAEFVAALQLLAQANDAEQGTRLYTKALTSGLVALKESSDFVRPIAGTAEIDVPRVVAAHKTPILKDLPGNQLTPMVAAQRYYTYTQEQLSAAAAQEMCGSMALFGLAKVAVASAGNNKSLQLERTAHAMTLYQAALIAAPKNFLAANELGVLLVETGNLGRARDMLTHSAKLSPHVAAWDNLAAVYERLGQPQLAEHARAEAHALRESGHGLPPAPVQQVDPETFATMVPVSDSVLPAVTPVKGPGSVGPAPVAAETKTVPAETARKGLSDWLPWNTRR